MSDSPTAIDLFYGSITCCTALTACGKHCVGPLPYGNTLYGMTDTRIRHWCIQTVGELCE